MRRSGSESMVLFDDFTICLTFLLEDILGDKEELKLLNYWYGLISCI
jgi:hypothetical protein